MFNDANLPADEAWTAMTSDLRKAKEDRNRLTRENAYVCSVIPAGSSLLTTFGLFV